jgi:putative RNA 2'-phosphotransferase
MEAPPMKHSHAIDNLSKFLAYMLGRNPDEFGLVPDRQGYVKIKDLVKALGEEPGWRHARANHIREVIYTSRSAPVEMEGNLIRAVDRTHLISPQPADDPPKLLYHPIRRRAYPALAEKGLPLTPSARRIILADDMALAQRMGRRIDAAPVILTVNSHNALKNGATLWRFGNCLYLSDCLPPGSFSGPPLPKNLPQPKKAEEPGTPTGPKTPGSYLLDPTMTTVKADRTQKGARRRKNEWKRERKRKQRDDRW